MPETDIQADEKELSPIVIVIYDAERKSSMICNKNVTVAKQF